MAAGIALSAAVLTGVYHNCSLSPYLTSCSMQPFHAMRCHPLHDDRVHVAQAWPIVPPMSAEEAKVGSCMHKTALSAC